MKRSVLRISACALLLSSISSVYALTPRKRADISDLTKNINNGSVSGSGIIDAIKKLNLSGSDLNDASITRMDRVNPKDGGLNQAAYNSLRLDGYTLNSMQVVQDIMSGGTKMPIGEPTPSLIETKPTAVVENVSDVKENLTSVVLLEDLLQAKELRTREEKIAVLANLEKIVMKELSEGLKTPENTKNIAILTEFKNDLEKNKNNNQIITIPTKQLVLSEKVKAKIEVALKTPDIVDVTDEPTDVTTPVVAIPSPIKINTTQGAANSTLEIQPTVLVTNVQKEEFKKQVEDVKKEIKELEKTASPENKTFLQRAYSTVTSIPSSIGSGIVSVARTVIPLGSSAAKTLQASLTPSTPEVTEVNLKDIQDIMGKDKADNLREMIEKNKQIPQLDLAAVIEEVKQKLAEQVKISSSDLKNFLSLIKECYITDDTLLFNRQFNGKNSNNQIIKVSDLHSEYKKLQNNWKGKTREDSAKAEVGYVFNEYLNLNLYAFNKTLEDIKRVVETDLSTFNKTIKSIFNPYILYGQRDLYSRLNYQNMTLIEIIGQLQEIVNVINSIDSRMLNIKIDTVQSITNNFNEISNKTLIKNTLTTYAKSAQISNTTAYISQISLGNSDEFRRTLEAYSNLSVLLSNQPLILKALNDILVLLCYTYDAYLYNLHNEIQKLTKIKAWSDYLPSYYNTEDYTLTETVKQRIKNFVDTSTVFIKSYGQFMPEERNAYNASNFNIKNNLKTYKLPSNVYDKINAGNNELLVGDIHKKEYVEIFKASLNLFNALKDEKNRKTSTGVKVEPLANSLAESEFKIALTKIEKELNDIKAEVENKKLSPEIRNDLNKKIGSYDKQLSELYAENSERDKKELKILIEVQKIVQELEKKLK